MMHEKQFAEFYNKLLNQTKQNHIVWKSLWKHPKVNELESILEVANDMPDMGTNSIKYYASYYSENANVGTLYLVEIYHPTTDPISGMLFLISHNASGKHPINLSSYYNVTQGQLGALRILIENNLPTLETNTDDLLFFINNFLD